MKSEYLKTQQAVVWSRRFALLYAFGVWTIIGFFATRSVRFREKPLQEEEKGGQPPPPPPSLDKN